MPSSVPNPLLANNLLCPPHYLTVWKCSPLQWQLLTNLTATDSVKVRNSTLMLPQVRAPCTAIWLTEFMGRLKVIFHPLCRLLPNEGKNIYCIYSRLTKRCLLNDRSLVRSYNLCVVADEANLSFSFTAEKDTGEDWNSTYLLSNFTLIWLVLCALLEINSSGT